MFAITGRVRVARRACLLICARWMAGVDWSIYWAYLQKVIHYGSYKNILRFYNR